MVFMLKTILIFNLTFSHVAILQNQADPDCSSGLCMPNLTQTQAAETSLDHEAGTQNGRTSQFAQKSFNLYLLSQHDY